MLHRAGLRLREIPVTMNPRYGGNILDHADQVGGVYDKVLLAILIDVLRRAPKLDNTN